MKNKCEGCPIYNMLVDAAKASGKDLPDIDQACVNSETGKPSECKEVLKAFLNRRLPLLTLEDILRKQDAYNRAFFVCVMGGTIPPDKKGE